MLTLKVSQNLQMLTTLALQPCDPFSWLHAGCSIDYDLFGVFDGHGGKQAANFASKHVLPIFQEELAGASLTTDTALPEDLSEYTELSDDDRLAWQVQDAMVQCLPTALVSTFRKVQDQFHANTKVCCCSATGFFLGAQST